MLQGNRAVRLTALEHQVLSALAANQGKVVTREGLMHLVYGDDPEFNVRSNVIDAHLSNLRRKLDNPPYLETVLGIGWKAATPAVDRSSKDGLRRVPRFDERPGKRGHPSSCARPTRCAWPEARFSCQSGGSPPRETPESKWYSYAKRSGRPSLDDGTECSGLCCTLDEIAFGYRVHHPVE